MNERPVNPPDLQAAAPERELFIGLMSGTSLDGVDAVLVDFSAAAGGFQRVLGHVHEPLGDELRQELLALNRSGPDELHRAALATHGLAQAHANATMHLLAATGCAARSVRAIGVHGQTVRHRPDRPGGCGYTVQLDPSAALGEAVGIDTVSDFRSQDLAAGGQGAPLVPAYHQALFARPGQAVAVVNVGGMANVSLLDGQGGVVGFDTGPGNVLMDACMQAFTGDRYDRNGHTASDGTVLQRLLQSMLAEPYFSLPPPKSTGRDLFSMDWLELHLGAELRSRPLPDLMATLCELTARSIAEPLGRFSAAEVWVCGGGAHNLDLMQRLQTALPGSAVRSTAAAGLPPDQVEACAFAWLARERLAGRTTTVAAVTGATGARSTGAHRLAPRL